jgi:GH35 family endo-1,4-beta-xylanase
MTIISTRHSCIDTPSFVRKAALLVLCVIAVQTNSASLKRSQAPPKSSILRQAAEARHILIGTAAAPRYLDEADYSAILGSEFSELEPENQMKFQVIHPRAGDELNSFDYKPADALADFAQSHNMLLRGHTLVWHNQIPDWVKQGHYPELQLATILKSHINGVVTHYASKVYAWDVVNEAFKDDGTMRDTLWYNQPGIGAGKGTQYIEQALRWAHAADPKAKLFYNDYDAEVVNQKSDAIYTMAKDFKQRGVPLDGIGFQTHVTLQFDNPTILSSYDCESGPICQARTRVAHHRTRHPSRRFQCSFARGRSQALWGDHDSMRAAACLQTGSNLGLHRQALVDSAILQRNGLGAVVGRQVSEEVRV